MGYSINDFITLFKKSDRTVYVRNRLENYLVSLYSSLLFDKDINGLFNKYPRHIPVKEKELVQSRRFNIVRKY